MSQVLAPNLSVESSLVNLCILILVRYVTSVLPAEGQSLKGDEVDKIVKFKSALGIDDPDAASMHMEVFYSFELSLSLFAVDSEGF